MPTSALPSLDLKDRVATLGVHRLVENGHSGGVGSDVKVSTNASAPCATSVSRGSLPGMPDDTIGRIPSIPGPYPPPDTKSRDASRDPSAADSAADQRQFPLDDVGGASADILAIAVPNSLTRSATQPPTVTTGFGAPSATTGADLRRASTVDSCRDRNPVAIVWSESPPEIIHRSVAPEISERTVSTMFTTKFTTNQPVVGYLGREMALALADLGATEDCLSQRPYVLRVKVGVVEVELHAVLPFMCKPVALNLSRSGWQRANESKHP